MLDTNILVQGCLGDDNELEILEDEEDHREILGDGEEFGEILEDEQDLGEILGDGEDQGEILEDIEDHGEILKDDEDHVGILRHDAIPPEPWLTSRCWRPWTRRQTSEASADQQVLEILVHIGDPPKPWRTSRSWRALDTSPIRRATNMGSPGVSPTFRPILELEAFCSSTAESVHNFKRHKVNSCTRSLQNCQPYIGMGWEEAEGGRARR